MEKLKNIKKEYLIFYKNIHSTKCKIEFRTIAFGQFNQVYFIKLVYTERLCYIQYL